MRPKTNHLLISTTATKVIIKINEIDKVLNPIDQRLLLKLIDQLRKYDQRVHKPKEGKQQ